MRPDTKTKLKKIREEVDKAIREEAGREKKEELEQQLEEKKAEKKRQGQERISKLSAAEQQKVSYIYPLRDLRLLTCAGIVDFGP